jgi:GT2 family glycosyltransferase
MPKWSGFALGQGAVRKAGLFDERFHPIYFEDNDYERRLIKAGVPAKFIHAVMMHDNSSTLNSGFHSQNNLTFFRNQKLFEKKVAEEDFSQGQWDLEIRRTNAWDQ